MKPIEYKLMMMKDRKVTLEVFSESLETLLEIASDRLTKNSEFLPVMEIHKSLVGRNTYWFVDSKSSTEHGVIRRKEEWE